jgi:hypothetical protein
MSLLGRYCKSRCWFRAATDVWAAVAWGCRGLRLEISPVLSPRLLSKLVSYVHLLPLTPAMVKPFFRRCCPQLRKANISLYKRSPHILLIICFQVPSLRVKQWISGRFTARMGPRNGTSKVRGGCTEGHKCRVRDLAADRCWLRRETNMGSTVQIALLSLSNAHTNWHNIMLIVCAFSFIARMKNWIIVSLLMLASFLPIMTCSLIKWIIRFATSVGLISPTSSRNWTSIRNLCDRFQDYQLTNSTCE